MANLFIALFWLILGLGLILIPGFERWRIVGTDRIRDGGLSLGWLAVALAGYNFLRWWLFYRSQSQRREARTDEPPARPREYNPEFDFTKDNPEQK